jgi:hypothetical protein
MSIEDFGVTTRTGKPGRRETQSKHVRVEYDANGDAKITVFPLQNDGTMYGSWRPVPREFRAASYNEPFKEGYLTRDGKKVWKKEKGFVDVNDPDAPDHKIKASDAAVEELDEAIASLASVRQLLGTQ